MDNPTLSEASSITLWTETHHQNGKEKKSDESLFVCSVDASTWMRKDSSAKSNRNETISRKDSKKSPSVSASGRALAVRAAFLDLPVLLVFCVYGSMNWFYYLHNEYLKPQIEAMDWTDERMPGEITYYERSCSLEDMSTYDAADLFLPLDATPADAYEHQLEHGFTVFRSILSPDVARDLRSFIVEKNRKLSALESIFVIEGENRFSFGLGTEEPTVSRAMKEFANHPVLRPSLEKIIGSNPALIEMTAITAASGAVAQWWHEDVIAQASAVRYAHTFGPAYSVFIPLQNTTREMGATAGCPGTHLCSAGEMENYCPEHGYQIVGEDGVWGVGDALLMNMNSWHRGGAHTDLSAEDRVMLILTFSPKMESRAESRQMSQGITYSLRWDMWGHTLYDLADADTRMTKSWATLRALGLFKPKEADWGVDFITGTSMRLVNDYNMYILDDLETFIENGGMDAIPRFLRATVNENGFAEEVWHDYLWNTFLNCKQFTRNVCALASVVYILASIAVDQTGVAVNHYESVASAGRRLLVIFTLVYIAQIAAKRYADESPWAADIRGNRRFSSVFGNDEKFGIEARGPTTLPNRRDVLVDNRHEDDKLALFNDLPRGNPGHRDFLRYVKVVAPVFKSYPDFLKAATINYVMGATELNAGRILGQGPLGNWYTMSAIDAALFVNQQLSGASNPSVGRIQRGIRSQKGYYRFGFLRNTALAKMSYRYLGRLEVGVVPRLTKEIGDSIDAEEDFSKRSPKSNSSPFPRTFVLPKPTTNGANNERQFLRVAVKRKDILPPTSTAWIKEGDFVEGAVDGYWYPGWVDLVDAHRMYHIHYPDGDETEADELEVRYIQSYSMGDTADIAIGEDFNYYPCKIVGVVDGETYNVELKAGGRRFDRVHVERLRRPYERKGNIIAYKSADWS